MKKLFVVANWKSNKTIKEGEEWTEEFGGKWKMENGKWKNLEIVLCPPFTQLYRLHSLLSTLHSPIKLGAQDISPFPSGSYTGEVSGRMLADLGVEYVIIGHSERRKYFKESEPILERKVREALDYNLTPIFCVQEATTPVPEKVRMIAYEPIFAIGTGTPDSPEKANEVAQVLKKRLGKETVVLYGGSVTGENVKSFSRQEFLSGVLVGGASLEPEKFLEVVKNASQI